MIKTVLYYFTGTGNSFAVAKDLAQAVSPAEVIPIARVVQKDGADIPADRVGIVFPVYMWGMPLLIAEGVQKLRLSSATYVFGIATHGGRPGGALHHLNRLLVQQGSRLAAGFTILMPGNYLPFYDVYTAYPQEHQAELFRQAQQKVRQIADIVTTGKTAPIEGSPYLVNLLTGLLRKHITTKIPAMDRKFWVNARCTRCEICVKVCPVNNLRLADGTLQWQQRCQQCLACLHWCPQAAIEYGKKTPNRKRYQHHAVTLNEMLAQRGQE